MNKSKNKFDKDEIKYLLSKLDLDKDILNYDCIQLQNYQKNNNLIIKNEIIEKLNKVGNIIYNCNNYDARVSRKRYNRPY